MQPDVSLDGRIVNDRADRDSVTLATINPRLFHSLILIEPIIFKLPLIVGPNPAYFVSRRRDTAKSRGQVEAHWRKNPFYSSMDPRAFELMLKYSLRDMPDGSVTFTTPKAQEAWTYVRANFHAQSEDTLEGRRRERLLDPFTKPNSPMSKQRMLRPEFEYVLDALTRVRPRTFFIFGKRSIFNNEANQRAIVAETGIGTGGSGGVKEGNVDFHVLEKGSHQCFLEDPKAVAKSMVTWLAPEMERWRYETDFWDKLDTGKSKNAMTELSDTWMAAMKEDLKIPRPKLGAEQKAKL